MPPHFGMELRTKTMSHLRTAKNIAVAVSGSGRSLENLINLSSNLNFNVKAVFASNPHCKAVAIANAHSIEVVINDYRNETSSQEILRWSTDNNIQLIVLAGFLKKFPTSEEWANRIINIHPALLPSYGGKGMYGMNVHNAVYKSGDKITGATIHFVNGKYDEGKIISQIVVSTAGLKTPEEIASKVFAAECQLLPQTIAQIIANNWPTDTIEVLNYE